MALYTVCFACAVPSRAAKKMKAEQEMRREATKMLNRIPPLTEGRIPVSETVFENIQKLVAKLKI